MRGCVLDKYLENKMLRATLKAVENNLAMPVDYIIKARGKFLKPDLGVDRTLEFRIDGKKILFCLTIKANISKVLIGQLIVLKDKIHYPLMLATNYVTGYMADQLRKNNIGFIDTAGNAFINYPPIYIFVKGNSPPDVFKQVPYKHVFRPTGLKVVFAFLVNPDLVKKPYRKIAETANVAVGNIVGIIRDLKELGYIIDMGRMGYKLIQKEKLLDRWITEYPERLRPKLLLGRFRGNAGWWKEKILNCKCAQWGAEVAAARLTKFLKPENITIYTKQAHLDNLLIENKLKKDVNGEVEILQRFWEPRGEYRDKDIVHPIIIYADLMATGNERNIETAKVIYGKCLIRYIGEG